MERYPFAQCVPVPSTRTTHNHLADLISLTGRAPRHLLTARKERNRRNADPELFATTRAVTGPVLLIEDCYVTGATAQSAAHTLTNAGATALMIVAIGRRLL